MWRKNLKRRSVTMLKSRGHPDTAMSSASYAHTVVRECCKGDDESQLERGKFDPVTKNPLTDGHQNLCW